MHDGAAGHVLAGVIAGAFDHGHRAGVPHGEALARGAGAVELAAGGAVEHRVAHEDGVAGVVLRRPDHDAPAAHALPHVVVRLADEPELDPGGEEGAEALAGDARERCPHATRWRSGAEAAPDLAAEPGADRAIGVGDRVPQLDEP